MDPQIHHLITVTLVERSIYFTTHIYLVQHRFGVLRNMIETACITKMLIWGRIFAIWEP